jgi:cation transporter-like permease
LLQKFVAQYDALPLILPVTSALAGNVGCIFASRLSTYFHVNASNPSVDQNTSVKLRDNMIVLGTLFSISLPIHLAFLGFVHLLGTFKFGVLFLIAYVITGALSVNVKYCYY